MKLAASDLYRLRHTQLAAQRATLAAQQAAQAFRELLLELEHQYGLLGTSAAIDVHTGEIETAPNDDQPSVGNLSGGQP